MKAAPIKDADLFEAIKAGRHQLLDELYVRYRAPFLTYAQRQLFATEADAADCFQDAVIAFYKNVVSGRLTELTCEIQTYLFAIGKRLIYRRNQQRQRETPTDLDLRRTADPDAADELDLSLLNRFEDDHRRAMLTAGMNQLGPVCRQVLTLFYYHRYPIESIVNSLDFSSPGAARIKKMRCLDQLKKHLRADR